MASVTARRVVLSLILVASTPCASGVTIDIQFVGDAVSAGFFTPERESVIQAAGTYVGSRLSDRLAAIDPVGEESFLGSTFYPGAGKGSARISSVPADTLVIFVGANDALGASTLAVGSPGGTSASGDEAFLSLARNRGQGPGTDFGPWGGTIAFNPGFNWYADPDPSTVESFSGWDLFSTAIHELGHLLGYGTATSWSNQVVDQVVDKTLTGANARSAYGGPVPLADRWHWASGLQSLALGGSQEAAMDPTLSAGTRKYFTELDWAGLADVGWEVVPGAALSSETAFASASIPAASMTPTPPPASVVLLGTTLVLIAGLRRRAQPPT